MKKLKLFNKILLIFVAANVILVVLFIYLNSFTHPRVSNVTLKGDVTNAAIKGQQIRIEFNRPIKRENISEFISLSPQVEVRTIWSGNSLIVIPSKSLNSETEYTLKISKDIQDVYGENFIDNYSFKFTTQKAKFAVIEKDFRENKELLSIYNSDLTDREIIVRRENIKFYGINQNFAVIVTEENFQSNIEVINLLTGNINDLNLTNVRINAFAFSNSPNKNEFAYTKQNIEITEDFFIPLNESKVYIYSLSSGTEREFNPSNTAFDVTELKYSNDGNSLIYKTSDSFYNIADTASQNDFSSVGRFLAMGNFSSGDDSIVFLSYDPLSSGISTQYITIFNSDRTQKSIFNNNIPVLDPQFKNLSREIIYAELHKELITTKGIFKIMKSDLEGNRQEIIKSDIFSLELPKLSPDDRFIAIEQYSEIGLKNFSNSRNMGFQNKPGSANIIIFDTLNNELINKNIIGTDVQWL